MGAEVMNRFHIRHLLMFLTPFCLWALLVLTLTACRPADLPSWQPASHGIKPQSQTVLIVMASDDPQTLYMVTYEPSGLYRSTDGGVSWESIGEGLEGVTVLSLAVDPKDGQNLYVGTVHGGYRSTDGGETWEHVPSLPTTRIYTLAVARDWQTMCAGTEGRGVYISYDGGVSWRAMGLAGMSVLSVVIAPGGTVYAGTSGRGLWISNDGGVRWQVVHPSMDQAHVPNLAVTAEGTVWALAYGSLYVSEDKGRSWRSTGPPRFEGLSMAVEPQEGEVIYIGGRLEGIAVSYDGGKSWRIMGDELSRTDITCLAVDTLEPTTAYLGTKGDGLYKTTDGGYTWLPASKDVGRRVVSSLVQDPHHPQTLYAGTLHGVYESANGGKSWTLVSGDAGDLYVQALAIDPEERGVVYAGTDSGVYISRDDSRSWMWASRALGSLTIFSLTIAPDDHNTVYAGSWGNNVLRSTDGGRSWTPVHHGLETLSVYSFAIDPADPRVLYAGTVEAIYKSVDAGESWRRLEGIRDGITTFALVTDPANPSLVYAGTTDGVYKSADGGKTWISMREGMGQVTVTTLALYSTAPHTLYAGTEHHGLFWSADAGEHWTPSGLAGMSIYAIVIDEKQGRVWVGTAMGVFRSEPVAAGLEQARIGEASGGLEDWDQ